VDRGALAVNEAAAHSADTGSAAASRTGELRRKVFGIGLNKTGTSSLKFAMDFLGYRTTGSNKALLREVRGGNVAAAIRHSRDYDFFQDWPWPLIYRDLHAEYGDGASYILTRRSTFEKWFASVESHARSSRLFSGQGLSYGYYRPFGRERAYADIYNGHNDAVRDYFTSGPGAGAPFLEMCLDDGDGWEKLCGFLGREIPDRPFPHRNTAAGRQQRWRGRIAVNRAIEPFYRAYARLF
jgi:hypothetical protein